MITFKKTLLAVSVLGFASSSVGAELSATKVHSAGISAATPSTQAITTRDDVVVASPWLHLGANYGAGDTITVTYSGASIDEGYSHPTGNLDIGTTTGGTCATSNLAVSFAGLAGNVATYTVGASDGANTDCFVKLPAVKIDGASLAAADKFNMAVSTSRGFGALETIAATNLVDVSVAELTVAITAGTDLKFDQIVDVNSDRYEFTATDEDIAAIVLGDSGGDATLTRTSVMTLTGDFSWAGVSTTTDGVTTVAYNAAQMGVSAGTTSNLGTVTRTATSLSWIAEAADTYTVTLTPQAKTKKMILPATTYALSTAMKYTNGGTETAILTDTVASAAGSWTLNGASITALGISNSPSVTPMIWIQNAGSSNGAITGSVNCNGTTITIADLGTAAAKSNTKVGEAIQTAVDAAGTCSTVNTRYDATVTVNGPAADITMNASYKVTAADGATDRVMLETTDSLPLNSVVSQ